MRYRRPTRSLYALTREEITRGIANRFVHSRTYIFLYLGMAALSITTVILSLQDGCPGLAFYILELIINTTMIAEVSIRFVAFGRRFWKSPFNVIDLVLTFFCVITVLTIVFAGCGSTSKEEELLDTLLLVGRNVLQFIRLAAVMRQSGQSIFSRPRPIDLTAARRAGFSLDLDLPEDAEEELARSRTRNPVLFDAQGRDEEEGLIPPPPPPKPNKPPVIDDRDQEDLWAGL
ncbi:uncharacterized protein FOMMEDRAFT_82807 [Fomitiporia mediterranea MF3/22]|uniref:uncharacterized protein n=1 Tax=Fomitiporia mediterranea (strain MF3/22) TaxID=694068 RepID=UPI0004408EB1|nr:uncharacterized protein FOMMEDRAFT_82807 [Fomitiporia mediterranea MF3/22]EJD03627.1 hypothetical protein FOMMEDRAFT_82807 [Fomitiporia mediterranea MF3/22]